MEYACGERPCCRFSRFPLPAPVNTANVENFCTLESDQHPNSAFAAAADDNLMKPTWWWWGPSDHLCWWIKWLCFCKKDKVFIPCASTPISYFLFCLHSQHLKVHRLFLLSSPFHLSFIWFSYFLLFHSWNINEMLCKAAMVQQFCGLQPQVQRHILSVITADINPLNFWVSKLALDKWKNRW